MTKCAVWLPVWFVVGLVVASAHAQTPSSWIDVHAHLIGPRGLQGAPAAATAYAERHHVSRMIVMTPPTPADRDDYEVLAQIARGNANRFAFLGGGGTLNPMLHQHAD